MHPEQSLRAVLGVSGKVWSCSVAQVRDLFGRSKFGQLTASCSRTNCMFLLPSSSSAPSTFQLQLRLHHSLGQGIPAAPAPGAALETVNSQCQSLVLPGNRLLTVLPREENGPAGIFGHKTVTGNSYRILEQLNETSTPSLASNFQDNNIVNEQHSQTPQAF